MVVKTKCAGCGRPSMILIALRPGSNTFVCSNRCKELLREQVKKEVKNTKEKLSKIREK